MHLANVEWRQSAVQCAKISPKQGMSAPLLRDATCGVNKIAMGGNRHSKSKAINCNASSLYGVRPRYGYFGIGGSKAWWIRKTFS